MSDHLERLTCEFKYAKDFNNQEFYRLIKNLKPAFEIIAKEFSKLHVTGSIAPIYINGICNGIKNYLKFGNIFPIEKDQEEFQDIGDNVYQSKRCAGLFKKEDDKPYYLNAIVWIDGDVAFTGWVNSITSRQYIRYPFIPKTFYVKVKSLDEENDSYEILDKKELYNALTYYQPYTWGAEQALKELKKQLDENHENS